MKMPKRLLSVTYNYIRVSNALASHDIEPSSDAVLGILELALVRPNGNSCAVGFFGDESDEYEEDIFGTRKRGR